jgi:hypothetical protein
MIRVVLVCCLTLACALPAHALTLAWEAPPQSGPALLRQYGIWRRTANATTYTLLTRVDDGTLTLPLTVPNSRRGKVCYQVRQILYNPSTATIVQQTTPAPVRDRPGCTALCYPYTTPAAPLAAGECYAP